LRGFGGIAVLPRFKLDINDLCINEDDEENEEERESSSSSSELDMDKYQGEGFI